MPLHHHESEQISMVLQGAMKFELEGREVMVRGGEVLVIPSNLPHSALAIEDSTVIEVFSPIRHDWLNGTDNYLRKIVSCGQRYRALSFRDEFAAGGVVWKSSTLVPWVNLMTD